MRIFATNRFVRFARKERIGDSRLLQAIGRADKGSIDANLGGSLIKQRVARSGGGRSGGYRTLIAYHAAQRSVFLYGFGKNARDNINTAELADLKRLAGLFLAFSDAEIAKALSEGELREIPRDDHEEDQAQ